MRVRLCMFARERPHYTELSLYRLLAATCFDDVEFIFISDGNSPEMSARLRGIASDFPQISHFIEHKKPIGVASCMDKVLFDVPGDFEFFAKVDNDVLVPVGWLDYGLNFLSSQEATDKNILVAGFPPKGDRVKGYKIAQHVGGIFVAKKSAFSGRIGSTHTVYGWTRYQHNIVSKRGKIVWIDKGWEALNGPDHPLSLDFLKSYKDYHAMIYYARHGRWPT